MKRKKLAMILAIVLAALMILPMLLGAFHASAASSAELKRLKAKASSLAASRKQIASELKKIENEKSSTIRQKAKLDEQIDLTQSEIENTQALIAELDAQIIIKQTELEGALKDEKEENTLFKCRVRAMEEAGEVSYLGVLLKSDDFSDLLGRIDLIGEILSYDKQVIRKLAQTRAFIDETKKSLEDDQKEQVSVKQDLVARKSELSEQCSASESMIKKLESQEADYKDAYEEAESAEQDLQKQINAMVAELSKSSVYVGGTYTWPLPGHYTITSPFGMRYHPVLKVNKLHTGVDISAPKGTKIVAANGGTVITAGYNSGYGNYVVINHGGGQATLYGHMSKISVSVNQKVKKSQQIGLVGSTGFSTGNHLHFEVIINGKQVDPMKYFSKK